MTASKFVSGLEKQYGASLVLVDGEVKVQNVANLPTFLKATITRHKPSLRAFLADGADCELDQQHYSDSELVAIGCRQLLAGEVYHNDGSVTQKWVWASDLGDEHLDRVLTGLLDAGAEIEQRKQAEAASLEAEHSAKNPPRGSILGRGVVRIPGL